MRYLIIVLLVVAGVYFAEQLLSGKESVDSYTPSWSIKLEADNEQDELQVADRDVTRSCVSGLTEYSNERYGFKMCVPEDAEVLTQYDAVDKSVLDLVFIQKTDLEKMRTSERFATDPYFAVLDTGISAFVMERSELLGEVDAERLKYILPKEIPCQHARFGCADGDTLAVKLLSFDPVAGAPFPLFAYKDSVNAKKPWQNVGYIGHIAQVSYQLESIVPESAVSREALEIIASSIH
ncbi:MAG: hypothetical protein COV07_03065 [Candidatus Vogelbacteria bacterium CG10_big_fil_rev_8_21_14_0_10_45_14]|uniref:Uncharacterized protein n=1 Tax=Candidatus Vogelbacteria bacterium CG10_big_fil_rev_8_21_14_0_10_45_14 TaxID=1975042 RepID=A0A2H0RJM4_9BACT|nr:MAG: hypothetical protein COV07_03065 [Candidatus Vogelbacteria bacterium CG10_big_fil_rev_8_21_14_0_10_45_14]